MTRLSPRHPRYRSLVVRARLGRASRSGLVVPEGLIAQGRGEAFDYLIGERTTASARRAERAAARWLLAAAHPVVSVNGNVAALAAREVARLARALPTLQVEVNLFHRTKRRADAAAAALRRAGVRQVLGLRPTARLPGLDSDRARIDPRGFGRADVCLIPLEDGDRAEALRRAGRRVIAIDLNPLSRTARSADLPIVDEVCRALDAIRDWVPRERDRVIAGRFEPFDRAGALRAARATIAENLRRASGFPRPPTSGRRRRGDGRPPRGSARRSRRTR